jgi:AcrR family transcriptional regulator
MSSLFEEEHAAMAGHRPARKPGERGTAVRDKILATARELFYRQGIRAVGVDTIVERSEVAKASLYHWFPTKDALIAQFLERENAEFWAYWDKVAQRFAGRPREELTAHLEWIAGYIGGPKFRGCPFLNATAEFPDDTHPGRKVCFAHKTELRRRLTRIAGEIGVTRPQALADQVVLLIDGAFANSQVLGKKGPAGSLAAAGAAMLQGALGPQSRGRAPT